MATGPVQLIVLGFNHPNFQGEIVAELGRLRENDTVRVLDALVLYKDPAGELEVEHLSNLSAAGAGAAGSKIRALVGLGIEGEEQPATGAEAIAEDAQDEADEAAWDVLEDIPKDSAAALVLLEHQWAVPLRDAVVRAGGFRISDGFISPIDLAGIGLLSTAEAHQLHQLETVGAASTG